jgi:hypothetical protein
MRQCLAGLVILGTISGLSPAAFAQGEVGKVAGPPDNRPFNPRDLSGVWWGHLYGYSLTDPPMTPEGRKIYDSYKPAYGVALGSPEAAASKEPMGRRRAIASALTTDPTFHCNPLGLIRLLFYAPAPLEIIQTSDRMLQNFEWTWDHREVWMDGRKLPDVDDYIPRYNGYSTGHWEGNTLVVETVGLDDRQWVDHFGYPLSSKAHVEERYKRANYSLLELTVTLTDPTIYTKPWVSDVQTFRLVKQQNLAKAWPALAEDRCVPADENDFFRHIEEPAGGVK